LGIEIAFEGAGKEEIGRISAVEGDKAPAVKVGDVVLRIDPRYYRPAEVETLLGDPTKARECLGWTPTITARQMCSEMVSHDLTLARQQGLLKRHGF
jgi:GDPmannose 4,6-dehydratase